jgi:hypothetical protein
MMQLETEKNDWREWRVGSWLIGIGGALIVAVIFGLIFSYFTPSSWPITQSIRARMPFPAVTIGFRNVVSFSAVSDDLLSVRNFYENQDFSSVGLRVDFTTEDGKKRLKIREREIINRMLENEAIRRAAKREGIVVTREQADKAVADQLNVEGNDVKGVETRLAQLYGWSIPQFTEKVVIPSLYEEELRKLFSADTSRFAESKKKIEESRKRLDDGRTFSDVAADLSEGRTSNAGGTMGWFSYGDLDEALRDAVKKQKVGISGDSIESELGFHIILVNDRKTEGGKEMVSLSQIFVKKQTFGDWLTEEMKRLSVHVLAPEYEWNRDMARVEFRDASLREFESNLLQNSEGDASLVF